MSRGRHRAPRVQRNYRPWFVLPMLLGGLVASSAPQVLSGESGVLRLATASVADARNSAIRGPTYLALPSATSAEARARSPKRLPRESGQGRRVVFSESRQRVWLVDEANDVERTYRVSGSKHDNLDPGTYAVYSTSATATAFDYSSTMEYMVRFTEGEQAAIGFHTIPERDGVPVQTHAELGTPLSSGCIRQRHSDAVALWEFAPVGTTVVVTP